MPIKKETIDSDMTLRSSLPDSDNDEMPDIPRSTTPEPSAAAVASSKKGPIGMGPKSSHKNDKRKMKKRSKSNQNKHHKKQKRSKSFKAKKQARNTSKKWSNARRNKFNRNGKTVQQCILLAVNAFGGKNGVTPNQIKKCLNNNNIFVSDLVLKKSLKKMLKKKVLAHTQATGAPNGSRRYAATGKNLSGPSVNRKKRLTNRLQKKDLKFRQKMRRFAHLKNRNGRTYEVVVFEFLSTNKNKTFNQIMAYLKANNMKCSNFVLLKVLGRLRKKNCVKLHKAKNSCTKKEYPKPQRNPFAAKQ